MKKRFHRKGYGSVFAREVRYRVLLRLQVQGCLQSSGIHTIIYQKPTGPTGSTRPKWKPASCPIQFHPLGPTFEAIIKLIRSAGFQLSHGETWSEVYGILVCARFFIARLTGIRQHPVQCISSTRVLWFGKQIYRGFCNLVGDTIMHVKVKVNHVTSEKIGNPMPTSCPITELQVSVRFRWVQWTETSTMPQPWPRLSLQVVHIHACIMQLVEALHNPTWYLVLNINYCWFVVQV